MKQLQRQKGFTLVEALVAVAILSIAATAAIQVFSAGAKLSSARAERYRLFHDAQMRLSLMRAEIIASGDFVARETVIGDYVIRERAEEAGAIDAEGSARLIETSVVIATVGAPERKIVTLTDFVVRSGR